MDNKFTWSYDISHILFKGISIQSVKGLIVSCIAVAIIAFLFEWFKYVEAKQRQTLLILRSQQIRSVCRSDSIKELTGLNLTSRPNLKYRVNITTYFKIWFFLYQLGIWFCLTSAGYIMMLIVMIFNGWLFISAIFGGLIGYFVFGQKFMKINLENCKIIRETFCNNPVDPDTIPSTGDGESTPALATPSTSREVCTTESTTVCVHSN